MSEIDIGFADFVFDTDYHLVIFINLNFQLIFLVFSFLLPQFCNNLLSILCTFISQF